MYFAEVVTDISVTKTHVPAVMDVKSDSVKPSICVLRKEALNFVMSAAPFPAVDLRSLQRAGKAWGKI